MGNGMSKVRIGSLLLSALFLSSAAWSSPASELVVLLEGLKSMQGRFEQVVLDQGGTRLQEAQGAMTLARGNRFYWHTLSPYEQLAVSDGKTLWVYDADLEQVVERPMGVQVANTPALLFGGNPEKVTQAFAVEQSEDNGGYATFLLRPRADDPLFDVLEVRFQKGKPLSMRLEDALGQQTSIDFRDVVLNKTIPASRFQFVAPEGTDVIRQQE
jgi:outer membrane lipoprotein carrier protein|tara:strand:+ start:40083 stop:40724 length:642 start_codon:yes stop_codon:yes gene_type:complete